MTIDFFSLANLHCDLVRQEQFRIEIRLLSHKINQYPNAFWYFLFFKFLLDFFFFELKNKIKKFRFEINNAPHPLNLIEFCAAKT